MECKPSTSKYQESSVFDNDNPDNAKQKITDAVHYCLYLFQKGKHITDQVSNSISSHSKEEGE
jgi:hypothetical protein